MSNINIENFYKRFPTMSHNRNRFPFEKEINFNMKMGEITPICAIRVVPGQTYNLDMSTVIKVAPMVNPPMDNATFKAFAFWNPDRNTWVNYKYWFGEKQHPEDPANEPTYLVPKVTMDTTNGCKFNGFYDNIGCPPGVPNYKIDAFLPRTDRQIYNMYFRNQQLENPIAVNTGDSDDLMSQNDDLRKICRSRDLYGQALPTVSGTSPVEIPLGSYAPVIFNTANTDTYFRQQFLTRPTLFKNDGTAVTTDSSHFLVQGATRTTGAQSIYETTTAPGTSVANAGYYSAYADLAQSMGAPLEGLYQAIAYNTLQYITDRSGNRYFERVSEIYGTVNPEGVLNNPEFLGSLSQMIQFDEVIQTSQTSGQSTPLGNRGANGYMENYGGLIHKSFGEFGWIIIYGVVTYQPKYQQGVSKLMQTDDPLELFNPIFNLMGDEAIYNSEIYVQSDSVVNSDGNPVNDDVFGYGKRNSRLLYPVSEIHGEQRSSYAQSLDTNHFAEYYTSLPRLNKTWDKVNDAGFKRSLVVTNETQFICNSLITGTNDIEIPINAIPSPIPEQIK